MIYHLLYALLLVVFYVLQTAIFSQTKLVSGTADIILILLAAWSLQERVKNSWLWTVITGMLVSLISAMPYFAPLMGYLKSLQFLKLYNGGFGAHRCWHCLLWFY